MELLEQIRAAGVVEVSQAAMGKRGDALALGVFSSVSRHCAHNGRQVVDIMKQVTEQISADQFVELP